jgi:lysozyme family protein
MAQLTPDFFQKILQIEGGYQNIASDNGNYACGQLIGTKYGVSAVAYSTWVNRCPTVDEMENLTENTAFAFYSWYFDRYNLFQINSQQFFELLANNTMGSPTSAARVEQQSLQQLGYKVDVDGVRGPQTIAALNDAWQRNPAAVYNLIRENWINYLKSLNKPQFLQGWLTRMEQFPPIAKTSTGLAIIVLIALGLWIRSKVK